MKNYLKWAKREYSSKQWFIVLVPAGVVLLGIIPYLIVNWSNKIDQQLHLPRFTAGAINPIVGLILILGGFALGLWSIEAQMTIGRGTPVPMMPTQKLVVRKPFTYCRNPMTLGTILMYMGMCVWIGSISAVAIVLILMSLLLSYIKLFEEKELKARFGAEYLEYKRNTPFILPRFRPRI